MDVHENQTGMPDRRNRAPRAPHPEDADPSREHRRQPARQTELIRELEDLRASGRLAREARRAALNLMDDIISARRAEERENAERLKAEEDLRASLEKYRNLFESIDEGFMILESQARRPNGEPDFCLVEVNPAGAALMAVGDLIGRPLREVVPDEFEKWQRILDRVATTGEPVRDEIRLSSKGCILEFYAFRMGTQAARVAVLFKDVTERRAVEQALREADQRKEEFLATLAHELRNPLAPVSNSLQILRLCFNEDSTVNEVCDVMDRQLNHMVRLVDDLMEVSRITRDSIELRKEETELAPIIRGALELSRSLIEAMEHRLAISLPSTPIPIFGDPVRLGQVFSNLLNNAAKYTDRGGQIRLTVRQEGDHALIKVTDTGIGIPEPMLPAVFEMFTQVDRTSNRSRGGLGIGLTLAKRLVEMHGGTITARSEGLGRGSEFVVTLPVSPVATSVPSATSDERLESKLNGRRVLVVDDNEDSAATLGRLLGALGSDVRIANDGMTALELVESHDPEVAFLDLGMPGMDGLEVARRIRDRSRHGRVVLVALTGWGQVSDRARTQDAGFDHHLVKPASMSSLRTLLS